MALLKCKMCGDSLVVKEDQNYCTCRSCGTTSTVPKGDDRQRARSFNRANALRRSNQFDKALELYEKLIEEDETDPEAHWCAVLCRFGIEYVEDPSTGEQMPTCHRASFDNILQDMDYLAAMDLAMDNYSRELYQSEAVLISEIMQDIVAISENEKPFDVFICYKESDELGNRTIDSTLAEDIYEKLLEKKYKVFFARITLEDKLGKAYEPYIFAALNSAKVMITLGTNPDYYQAVWLKNEWNRFLALMKKDKSKLLIPCYRDMNPREMPQELAMLQSQDMGKIGFMQDLIRGVEKVLGKEKKQSEPSTPVQASPVEALLKRVVLFLEDENWEEAEEYCERVLDIDPECGMAYAYLLCTEKQCRSIEELKTLRKTIDTHSDYKKAIRFSTGTLKSKLEQIAEIVKEQENEDKIERTYRLALQEKNNGNYEKAIAIFESLQGYKKSVEEIASCEELIKERIYGEGLQAKYNENYEKAIAIFQSLQGYKDWKGEIELCQQLMLEAEELAEEEERQARELEQRRQLEVRQREEEARQQAILKKEKLKTVTKLTVGFIASCLLIAFGSIVYTDVLKPEIAYMRGVKYLEQGEYGEAFEIFESLSFYKDSITKLSENKAKYSPYWRAEEATTYSEYNNNTNVTVHSDGTVSFNGYWYDKNGADTDSWTDIVSVAAGFTHIVGLRSDGTLVATGSNDYGESSVSSYKDVISIIATARLTSGLMSDGTVFVQGKMSSSTTMKEIGELKNILSIAYAAEYDKLTTTSVDGQVQEFIIK